ncbi:MAG: YceI family protein [Balneolaceae bacterium]
MKRILSSILLLLLLTTTSAIAQTTYDLGTGSELSVEGTSNVRDWDGVANELSGTLLLSEPVSSLEELQATDLQSLTLEIPVEGLENNNGKLTSNMHKYLKGNDHPVISFKLTGVDSLVVNGSTAELTSRGEVTVAGVTLPVMISNEMSLESEGTLLVNGVQDLKMTDFGIDPPTAMFGAIRAVDDVQIHYTLLFQL